jgi:hypothetical protein
VQSRSFIYTVFKSGPCGYNCRHRRYQERFLHFFFSLSHSYSLPPHLSPSLSLDMGSETNGQIEEGFEIPEINIKFTQLFINGCFVDALSGSICLSKTFRSQFCLIEVDMSCIINHSSSFA